MATSLDAAARSGSSVTTSPSVHGAHGIAIPPLSTAATAVASRCPDSAPMPTVVTASWAARIVPTDSPSRASRSRVATPSCSAIWAATARTPAGVWVSVVLPLMQIAPRNKPRAAGTPSKVPHAPPPADWPAIVTFAGSPPNAAMFSCTHSSARTQSRTARFVGAPGTSRKPPAPSR
jgi:hypothetical protein